MKEINDWKRRWALLQVSSEGLGNSDIISTVSERLRKASEEEVRSSIRDALQNISTICDEQLFLVLDEANVPARMLPKAFMHDDGKYHSALPELIRRWHDVSDGAFTFVIMGTDVPKKYMDIHGLPHWRWSSDTGSFMRKPDQEQYLAQLCPEGYFSSPRGRTLEERIWKWQKHRYVYCFNPMRGSHSLQILADIALRWSSP